MSFKDLGKKDMPPRVETHEEAELRARAAARHKAKEERAAKSEDHGAVKKAPPTGRGARGEPPE